MTIPLNFLPGKLVLWKERQWQIVDCQDFNTVIVQEPGKRKLCRVSINELQVDYAPPIATHLHPDLLDIPEKAWEHALGQYESIRPLIEKGPNARSFADVKAIADELGKHPATIYRWIDQYLRDPRVSVFLRKPRSDQGARRIPEAVEKIIGDAINLHYLCAEKKDAEAVIEEVREQCKKVKVKAPHDNTVRNRIALVSDRTKLERREGRKVAQEKFEPKLGHFPGADYPLAVVQIDHTPMDVIVVDEEDRQPINRPYLTIVIDIFSRVMLGFAIYLENPSAFTSGLAIAHAILPKEDWLIEMGVNGEWPCWGKFQKLHCDNAKEFRGHVIGRACQEHQITVEHRPVKCPRYGGHVERGFRTFMRRVQRLKGTTFSSIAKRLKYDSSGRAIMTRAELERWFTIYIVKFYNNKYHRGIKDTPIARFKSGILGTNGHMGIGLPERVPNPQRFMLDFMPFDQRSVQHYGILINHIYYYDDALRQWIGSKDPDHPDKARKFIIRYIPRDMREVYFYDPTSKGYVTIPYRDRTHPAVSYWEILAAERRLREHGHKNVNEDLLFEAIWEMREIEDASEKKTKTVRRQQEKRKHQPKMPVNLRPSSGPPAEIATGIARTSVKEDEGASSDQNDQTLVDAFDGIVEPD